MANSALPAGTPLKNGAYVIVRRISNGGMGMVYLAQDSAQGIPVVIKEYLPQSVHLRKLGVLVHLFNSTQQRAFDIGLRDFLLENHTLSSLSHPNITQVLDCFQENHTAYSVMEYVYGQSLQQIIRGAGSPGIEESLIASIFKDVFRGVSWLHEKNIIHLDLKPGNIYLTHSGKAVILDFGTAWHLGGAAQDKKRQVPMHTPGFAPIEQHRSHFKPDRIGPQTDLYALGATLYACVSGRTPTASHERIESGDFTSASRSFLGEYHPLLLAWIDRLLILEWHRRPASATQLFEFFETFIPSTPINPMRSYFEKFQAPVC
jgi:serine/threonine protein kinase